MKTRINRNRRSFVWRWLCVSALLSLVFLSACSEIEKPKPTPFYAETAPPQKKELRWSNGKMAKSFDPALAAAPPETDIVRAIYEGLTDTDPKTLETLPAVAVSWEASPDHKTWTFKLRPEARWSNGEPVTAHDFVRSWKRLTQLGEKVPLRRLLKNIVGMDTENVLPVFASEEVDVEPDTSTAAGYLSTKKQVNTRTATPTPRPVETPVPKAPGAGPSGAESVAEKENESNFGVEAVDDQTLKVSLVNPDADFPALVAHPLFRPVYGDGTELESEKLNAAIVTNGAFRISSVGPEGVTLDRSDHYWAKSQIELERVRFVPKENAEKALEAYRTGEVDAVTNANFEPLALKLLTPYDDFRRTTHGALNFYEFNRRQQPFSDRRVREALAIAIERERLTEDEMDGSTKPALSFLPFEEKENTRFVQDKERAKNLLAEAGFPNGENFPRIRLLINRNDVQQRIARAVARMWKQNLNVETEVIVKEIPELETARQTGDFDLLRRGSVIPTTDKAASLLAIFPPKTPLQEDTAKSANGEESEAAKTGDDATKPAAAKPVTANANTNLPIEAPTIEKPIPGVSEIVEDELILTEEEAIAEIPAIPLYFPTSYSLVKPYVLGFEINALDAPSLKSVWIDINWQPSGPNRES